MLSLGCMLLPRVKMEKNGKKWKKNDFSRFRDQNRAFMAQREANELDHDEEHILMSQIQEWKFNIEFGMYASPKGKNGKY